MFSCFVVFRATRSSCLPNAVRTFCFQVTRMGSCRAVTQPIFPTSPGKNWKNFMRTITTLQMHGMLPVKTALCSVWWSRVWSGRRTQFMGWCCDVSGSGAGSGCLTNDHGATHLCDMYDDDVWWCFKVYDCVLTRVGNVLCMLYHVGLFSLCTYTARLRPVSARDRRPQNTIHHLYTYHRDAYRHGQAATPSSSFHWYRSIIPKIWSNCLLGLPL